MVVYFIKTWFHFPQIIFFMKKIMLLVCLFMGNALFSHAASSNDHQARAIDVAAMTKNPELESLLSKADAKQQKKIEKLKKKIEKASSKKRAGNQVLAVIVCLFLGGLGLHRLVMGSKPILILGYILMSLLLIGWIVVFIDLIRLIINPAPYEGNNKLFAAFS